MSRSKLRDLVAFPLFLAAVIVVAVVYRDEIAAVVAQLRTEGAERTISPLLVVALQILQVVVFIIPGEVVQIGAGFLFGVAGGAALSLAGIAVGSLINYTVGRLLGRRFVTAITSERARQRIDSVMERRGTRIGFFLLFVIPGIPKDILGYVAGAAGKTMNVGTFLLFSMVGRVPGIVGSAMIGASAAAGRTVTALVLFSLAALALILGVRHRRRIEAMAARVLSRRVEVGGGPTTDAAGDQAHQTGSRRAPTHAPKTEGTAGDEYQADSETSRPPRRG
ncbi:MAG: VTT domain-containing protein [Spirochaetales bacterium]|nr:VTT domain-containing protein [Spirochaetales bacterium]